MTASEGPGIARGVTEDERHQFIPVRKTDILVALIEHGDLASEQEREQFRQVCRLLGAIYHYEYFDRLERLRDAYYYFNPDLEPPAHLDRAALERHYAELTEAFLSVLKGANFIEVPPHEIEQAHDDRSQLQVKLKVPLSDFREVRFFHRGSHNETLTFSQWLGLRKHVVETEIHDDVVLYAAAKFRDELPKGEVKRLDRRKIRPGGVIIKYFRNIARIDLHALFPGVRVTMSLTDKLFLGLPALVGGVPILLNLASTVTVLFLVIGFYLGFSGAIEDDQLKTAFAALSGLIALGGFMMRQVVKYQRQSLKHQQELTDNVYFRNVNNNAGIFDYIIGAAEEQECKEAFLAYYFLRAAPSPPTQEELDARIEAWLLKTFGVDIDFEVDDALAKLDRLKLLCRDGERLSVPPPEEALVRLDIIWDNYFQFNVTEGATAPVP
jgi:hypothetical protein